MIDSTYRTTPDRGHRAMAGLSLGGTQTLEITQSHLDEFAYIGCFSAPFDYPQVPDGFNGLLGDPAAFARQVKVLFISYGTAGDHAAASSQAFHQALEKAGIKHIFMNHQAHRARMADLASKPPRIRPPLLFQTAPDSNK